MGKTSKKKIMERAVQMNSAWEEGAPGVTFKGVKQSDLDQKITSIEAKENERATVAAHLDMLDSEIENMYKDLDNTTVNVGDGVRGDTNYGNDSPLYGAMGFIRKSERKSGLVRKPKTNGNS